MPVTVTQITPPATSIGEGPHWDDSSQSLIYVDINAGDVHRWNSATNDDVTVLHRGKAYLISCWHRDNLSRTRSRSRSGTSYFVPCKHSIWIASWIILIQIFAMWKWLNNGEQCDALCCIEQWMSHVSILPWQGFVTSRINPWWAKMQVSRSMFIEVIKQSTYIFLSHNFTNTTSTL